MSTQPSEHAMRAAKILYDATATEWPPESVAPTIDQHAVEPATRELREQVAELMQKAQQLTQQLRLVHKDPRYRAVWEHAHNSISLGEYQGPSYADELASLEAVLAKY